MRGSRRNDAERVADMLEATERIQEWSPDGVPEAHTDIPWKDVIGQRVQLAHHYWDTQWARIQQTVAEDVPALKAALLRIPAAPPEDS